CDLALLYCRNRLLEGRHEIPRLDHGSKADGALRPPERGAVDIGIRNPLPYPTVLRWAITYARDPLLMELIVEVRAVVADDQNKRDPIVHGRPDRGHAHAEVTVAANPNRQPSRAFERERGANGDAR